MVVAALAPAGPLAGPFRDVYRSVARLADAETARLFVVGGYSSLRPAARRGRFVTDLSQVPAELHDEILAGAALIIEDLPAAPATLNWVFVSPALGSARICRANDSAVTGSATTSRFNPRTAEQSPPRTTRLGLVDLIEKGDHHRAQVNLGH